MPSSIPLRRERYIEPLVKGRRHTLVGTCTYNVACKIYEAPRGLAPLGLFRETFSAPVMCNEKFTSHSRVLRGLPNLRRREHKRRSAEARVIRTARLIMAQRWCRIRDVPLALRASRLIQTSNKSRGRRYYYIIRRRAFPKPDELEPRSLPASRFAFSFFHLRSQSATLFA